MGRPISYDKTAVVGAALEQFWRAGFTATNIDTLIAGTGLNKHSLYQAFDGKTGLFIAALELYLAEYSQTYLAIF
ncbi:MAG TPA: TetR family transcriptional regulator, partial [Spongiibacteraceae bacterium]|nr:TetR family transcriptional regulator [Spongiibacteraceae bacterium]